MAAWQTKKSEVVYETPWIKVRRDEVVNHADQNLTYSVVELRHPSVFIVAVNVEGKIFMQKNYRYTIDQTIWELPAGHSEGKDPLEAAAKELLEEDGLISDDWQVLGRLYQAIGTCNMPIDVCLARSVYTAKNYTQDKIEQIDERQFFTLAEINDMIKKGTIINAADIGVIQLANVHGF